MPPVSILDHPGTAKQLWPLSVEAYHALGDAGLIPEKTELLYGFVFNKMSKSPLHSALAQRIRRLLEKLLGPKFIVRQEQPITCSDSEPEPDLAVVHGDEADFWECHPNTAEIVVEVAVSSPEYDRDKAAAYASAGVKEFWILLVPEQEIEIYSAPVSGAYQQKTTIKADETATSSVIPSFTVKPGDLLTR